MEDTRPASRSLGVASGYRAFGCLALFLLFSCVLKAGQTPVGRSPATDDAQILRQAQGAFNTNSFVQARQFAERIRDASGSIGDEAKALIKTIDDIEANNTKRTNVIIAIQRGRFPEACALIRDIQAAVEANKALRQRYTDLNSLREKAGGCQVTPPVPEPTDTSKPEYDRAMRLRENGRLTEALQILTKIRSSHPGYRDVESQIPQINKELKDIVTKGQDERFADLSKACSQLLREGDCTSAVKQLKQAESLRPDDPGLKQLRRQIDDRLNADESELFNAVEAFYGGKYQESEKTLEAFLGRAHCQSAIALARFYAGAALGSRFLLSGGKDLALRDAAVKMFEQSVKGNPAYQPRWDAVSPKLKDLYSEAGKPK